jgi:hypothetical protein
MLDLPEKLDRDKHSSLLFLPVEREKKFYNMTPGVNVIKLFPFITDSKAKQARGFVFGNPFQSGLRI